MKHPCTLLLTVVILLTGCRAEEEMPNRSTGAPGEAANVVLASTDAPTDHILVEPGTIDWQPGPASLESGAEAAILEGNPAQPGFFNLRLRMPDGFRIAPHSHPQPERVTVISGTFLLGEGDEADPDAAQPLQPGSYFSMPPGMQHYAVARGETVIQLTSTGPWEIEYVNPDDDPRLR